MCVCVVSYLPSASNIPYAKVAVFGVVYSDPPASQAVLVVKKLPVNAGDIRDRGSIPGSGRSPGGERGNPFQYSCLENP